MIWLLAYVLSIVAANATLALVGLVPVWPGVLAPAGVLWAGIALTLRDLVHDALGRWWTIAAILVGASLSYLISPSFAVASGLAFLISELADFGVYAPIRRRHWLTAIVLSNTAGLVIDSVLFLWLAFGSLEFLAGQIIGKAEMTLLALPVLLWMRSRRMAGATA